MRFFVFVETPYYPYVADPIEASDASEAERLAIERECPHLGDTVYVAPASAVRGGPMQGCMVEPKGLLKLLQESNRLHGAVLDAKNLSGGFTVVMDPGSLT